MDLLDWMVWWQWDEDSSYELGYYVTEGKKRSWEIKLMSNLKKKAGKKMREAVKKRCKKFPKSVSSLC